MSSPRGRVLVAGASGMAGRAITRALRVAHPGLPIRAVHCAQSPGDEDLEWARADLRAPVDCARVAAGCDRAILAAASTSGSRGMARAPWRALDDNLVMTVQLLEALHESGVRRVVFLSSASLYAPSARPLAESDLDLNEDPHPAHFGVGWAFRALEKVCEFWHRLAGTQVVVLRCANFYGPFAAFDPERANVVPALIRKAVERRDPFEVWGAPDVVRDVFYVDDLAEAVVKALAFRDAGFSIFNVGSGRGVTISEIARTALSAADHRPTEVRFGATAPETVPARILDCTAIHGALGWVPRFGLEDGIRLTTRWWADHGTRWIR